MKNILTILLCAFVAFVLACGGAYVGHHFSMIILEQVSHSLLIEISLSAALGTVCLLCILLLQLIKICSGFKLWSGKYKAYLNDIEKEATRIKKQKQALENGE